MVLANAPIKRRLRLVILLASLVVLLLTSAAFAVYELVASRQELARQVQVMAQIIGANSSGFLLTQSDRDASEMLNSLNHAHHIVSAALYDQNGHLFAHYPTNADPRQFPTAPHLGGKRFTSNALIWLEPVVYKNHTIGMLYLRSNLEPWLARFRVYVPIGMLVMLSSFLVALVLSSYLQKAISQPILELADLARQVSAERNYSVRAQKVSNDEVGVLTDAFNHMLAKIQDHEAALQESAERLQLALEASQTGIWDWNMPAKQLTADRTTHRQFGLAPTDANTSSEAFMRNVHPDDLASLRQSIATALDKHQAFNSEFRVRWPDGSLHHLSARGKAIYDSFGRALRMSGVCLDITERKKIEESLARQAAALREQAELLELGNVLVRDMHDRLILWTAGTEQLYGWPRAEVLGQNVHALLQTEFPGPLNEIRTILFQRGEWTGELVHHRRDGRRLIVASHWVLHRDESGQPVAILEVNSDVTERKQAEDEVRRLNTELEQRVRERTAELTDANQELEAFTYSVSHDLRAPLRHVDAFARILQEELGTDQNDELLSYIARIRRGTDTMGKLIDDLLNLSRVSRSQPAWREVDLSTVLEDVLSELRAEVGGRQIEWRIERLPKAKCDPGLIQQVFANLLSNAVKYTRPRNPAVIEVGSLTIEGEPVIYVRDNGVGFSMKHVQKLFGVFERLHPSEDFEGTGIGLAVVRRIIQKHNGRVWAEGEPDQGATFYFTLPGLEVAPAAR